jgi:hypothetical protein
MELLHTSLRIVPSEHKSIECLRRYIQDQIIEDRHNKFKKIREKLTETLKGIMAQNSKIIQKVFASYVDYPFIADFSITLDPKYSPKQILIFFATEEERKKINETIKREDESSQ